ncbi:MAG: cupredoxin domain-containing protein [Actinomycetota bacterium]
MRTVKILFVAAVMVAACVACSSADNGGAVQTPPVSTTPTATGSPSSGLAPVAVSAADDLKFAPDALTIKVGTQVVWTVTGSAAHTVTAQSGATFDSSNLNQGETFTQTFDTPGTIKYFCKIHGQSMSGTITVQA